MEQGRPYYLVSITCLETLKTYYGARCYDHAIFKKHLEYELNSDSYHYSPVLIDSLQAYGINNHRFETIRVCKGRTELQNKFYCQTLRDELIRKAQLENRSLNKTIKRK